MDSLGGAISLPDGTYLTVTNKELFAHEEGSLVMWVRPHWSNYGEEASGSHTFISFSWDDEKNAYGVLSDGWWEPHGGQPFTYFIFDNQRSAKTEKRIAYHQGDWLQFVCTWRSEPESSVKLYANGLLVGESRKSLNGVRRLKYPLVIGADKGAPGSIGRYADSDIDEFAIFSWELKTEEVMALHMNASGSFLKSGASKNRNSKQIRAIFDEGRGWMTEEGAQKTISRIKKAGFNIYIPCVWHGMGSRYPTSLVVAEKNQRFYQRDPLARLIEIAHAEGIEVHPWFTVTLRQREFLTDFYDSGTPKQAFNIHDSKFREFIINLMLDVVKRYDIDGLNLDYIRSMGFCISQECQRDYNKTYGRDLLKDILKSKSGLGLEASLQNWNEQAVEAIVKDVSKRGKMLKPDLIVSVDGAPIPDYQTPNSQGRNEIRWANSGYVDIIFNMDYKKVPDFERLEFVRSKLSGGSQLIPLLGNYDKGRRKGSVMPREATDVVNLSEYSLIRFPAGFGLYIYSQLSDLQVEKFSQDLNNNSDFKHGIIK
jgi:hypothetical protein